MVVSGLPVDRRDHARALALLALGKKKQTWIKWTEKKTNMN